MAQTCGADNRHAIARDLVEMLVPGTWRIESLGTSVMIVPDDEGRNSLPAYRSNKREVPPMPRDRVLHAVYEEDLPRLLKSLGLSDALDRGVLRCYTCDDALTAETVGCIFPYQGEIHLCCERLSCLDNLPVKPLGA